MIVLMSLDTKLGWPGFRPSLLPFWNLFVGLGLAIILSVLCVLYANKSYGSLQNDDLRDFIRYFGSPPHSSLCLITTRVAFCKRPACVLLQQVRRNAVADRA
jgi:hypothetical protein